MRFVALGFLMAIFLPLWAIAVIAILLFMAGATRRPYPKRRKR